MSTSRFLAGALIGIVAGLLIAPEKGEDMRDNIVDTAQKWKKKLNHMAGRTGAELQDLRDLLQDEVEGLGDDVRRRLLTILDESASSAAKIKKNIASEVR